MEGQKYRFNEQSFIHIFEKQDRKSEDNWKCCNMLTATTLKGLKSLDKIRSQLECTYLLIATSSQGFKLSDLLNPKTHSND